MKRALLLRVFLLGFAAACVDQPIGQPAGDNNYDDPDDPGQPGQGGSPDAAGDASGRFCIASRDCPAIFVCAYPIADSCGASGRCLPYTMTSSCSSMLACGCDGTDVALCAPDGFAPKPVKSAGACDGGTVIVDAGSDASDGGTLADASDDGAIDDGSDQ